MRPWLPTLLALSVNSPFTDGRDRSYQIWRIIRQGQFPGAGIPPCFRSARDYVRLLQRLMECGHLVDPNMTFCLARPSGRFSTSEVRVADAAGTVDEAVLQAALTRALARTIHGDVLAGRPIPEFTEQEAAAVWSAARYGLDGPGVEPHPRWTGHGDGTGATRQPRAAAGGPAAVVGMLVAQTSEECAVVDGSWAGETTGELRSFRPTAGGGRWSG
ncbi:glutamate-cysteine ligase family protein [Actinopolymorpha pittospori]|uniref:Gamma-glutamyl:cysteine ligase YbdK (ATP-grasp superfamily) n=1 Tax=Actinopolymorpha pittospori TaxID=648752 RepID=A0A927MY02_9ACTN|nr:gamma-glutamyl:cysteine ligase YbdK (ATP-grasp superfamily) [Actinopolymorpha pittospori]